MADPTANSNLWSDVDGYITDRLLPPDAAREAALAAADAAGLPAINVSPAQGRMLTILARLVRARRILEIGTLAGYSTLFLAEGLEPGGQIVTLEIDPRHAAVARENFARAGIADRVDLREGPAIQSLPKILEEGLAPFDMVFIDADKPSNPDYLAFALKLARPGTLIVSYNVVRGGRVLEEHSPDRSVQGTRALFDALAADPRLMSTAVQTVGAKGYDGFALTLVLG